MRGNSIAAGERSGRRWPYGEVALWAVAVGGFALAAVLSWRSAGRLHSGDLRTPAILLFDALLAAAVALVYVIRLRGWSGRAAGWWALPYGLCASAAFRLVPPIINERALYFSNLYSLDVPYGVMGAAVHSGIAVVLANFHARSVVLAAGGSVDDATRRGASPPSTCCSS
jgi:hypothetical protein